MNRGFYFIYKGNYAAVYDTLCIQYTKPNQTKNINEFKDSIANKNSNSSYEFGSPSLKIFKQTK